MTDESSDRVFSRIVEDEMTWADVLRDHDACCFCDRPLDDRRFAVGLAILRAWSPNSVGYAFCHVECLRKAMHPSHKV